VQSALSSVAATCRRRLPLVGKTIGVAARSVNTLSAAQPAAAWRVASMLAPPGLRVGTCSRLCAVALSPTACAALTGAPGTPH
jgi:hypothetical protein